MLNKLLRKKQRKARSNKSSNDDATTSTAASTATGASSPPKKSTTTRRGLDDSFPEITQLPEFYNDELLYKNGDNDNDDLSVLSRHSSNQYDTKEDQDVAVFMALAGRMNLDSLLFILQGHARELNLPSAECLLPVNAAKIKAERAAAAAAAEEEEHKKPIKQFRWKEAEDNYNDDGDFDGSGTNTQVACQVYDIESIKDCKDAWWSDDEMHTILTSAIKDGTFVVKGATRKFCSFLNLQNLTFFFPSHTNHKHTSQILSGA